MRLLLIVRLTLAWPSMLCCAERNPAKAKQEACGLLAPGCVRREMQRFRHVGGWAGGKGGLGDDGGDGVDSSMFRSDTVLPACHDGEESKFATPHLSPGNHANLHIDKTAT